MHLVSIINPNRLEIFLYLNAPLKFGFPYLKANEIQEKVMK